MPLMDFQKAVARSIAANRKPESHVAGGAVINRGEVGNVHDRPITWSELRRKFEHAQSG